jgi:hypothetical protein
MKESNMHYNSQRDIDMDAYLDEHLIDEPEPETEDYLGCENCDRLFVMIKELRKENETLKSDNLQLMKQIEERK